MFEPMKKPLAVLGLGAGAFLIFRALRLSNAADKLNVKITNVDFNRARRFFVVTCRLINPTRTALSVDSITADALWNDTAIGTINFQQKTEIKPLSEISIDLPVKMNADILSLFGDIFSKGGLKKTINGTFELRGVVSSLGLNFPLEYKNSFKLI